MIRSNIRKFALLPAFIPFGIAGADVVTKDTKTVREADLTIVKQETGWERLQEMFSKDEFGRIAPELHTIIQVACLSSFIGAMYGGILYSREAYLDFIRNNQATAFRDHLEAKKRLQERVTLSFTQGAFKWGWRLTFFCTTYVTLSTSLAAYRGKNGILEHVMAGAVAGSTYKFKMGPRGWIVGGGLGVALGTVAGVATSALLSLTGMTMEDVRYWNYKWSQSRTDHYNKELKRHLEKEELLLLMERESKLENTGAKLETNDVLDSIK